MVSITAIIEDAHIGAGVLMNCLLLYAIRRFTRKALGSYKQLLTIFAGYDVFLTVMHAIVKPKVVIAGTTTFGVVCEFDDRKVTSFYCACFTVPFTLMNIHFVYRFWSIRKPHLIPLFSDKKFIAFISCFPVMGFTVWYLLCIYVITGEGPEIGKSLLSAETGRRFGKSEDISQFCLSFALLCFDIIMVGSFSVASTLGGLTFYYIRKADTISIQANSMQLKLFIAVCAQTFVPLIFVYIPYFCVLNAPFFRLPVYFMDDACMLLTSCFPAWDAVIMIVLMKDYREGFLAMFRKKPPPQATTVWKTATSQIPSDAYPSTIASSVMERSFAALLIVSALSQQIMLVCQVAMFAYDLYIENLMPATESSAPNQNQLNLTFAVDEYWFCMVHECCYFITTFVAIMIVIERLIATVNAESYETLPMNKSCLAILVFIGVLLSLPFSYVIHELDQYFPPIALMSAAETVVIVLSIQLYLLTTQRLKNLPYDFKRVSAKYQLGEVLLFTRAVLVPILVSSVLKFIGLVPPLLWKLGYTTYAYAGTAFFMTHAINCVLMKGTMIVLHKGMRRTLFKTIGITHTNHVFVVQPMVPKTDETTKYFEMLREAWA